MLATGATNWTDQSGDRFQFNLFRSNCFRKWPKIEIENSFSFDKQCFFIPGLQFRSFMVSRTFHFGG